jgi:long-chain fatty acid transport protein
MRIAYWPISACFCLFLTPAIAAGYGLREFGADAMGGAFAGVAATGSDATYQIYNPATLDFTQSTDMAVGATAILPSSSATYKTALASAGTPAGGRSAQNDFIPNAYVPNLALRTRLSDAWSAGVAVSVPWGLSTDYDRGSDVRYYALKTKFTAINITPSVAYRISPELTIAAGAQIANADGTLSSAIDVGTVGALFKIPGSIPGKQDASASLTARDWAAGYSLGAIFHASDSVTLGLAYHSAVDHELSGPLTYKLGASGLGAAINATTGAFTNTPAKVAITTPDTVNAGARVALPDQLTALVEADWTNWSTFQDLKIEPQNPHESADVTTAKWKSAWFLAAGLEYKPDGPWSFKTGVGYDESPIPGSTLNPRIPDGDRTVLAVGAGLDINADTKLSLGYEHLFIPDRNIALNPAQTGNSLRGTLVGTTSSSVNAFSVDLTYRLAP